MRLCLSKSNCSPCSKEEGKQTHNGNCTRRSESRLLPPTAKARNPKTQNPKHGAIQQLYPLATATSSLPMPLQALALLLHLQCSRDLISYIRPNGSGDIQGIHVLSRHTIEKDEHEAHMTGTRDYLLSANFTTEGRTRKTGIHGCSVQY